MCASKKEHLADFAEEMLTNKDIKYIVWIHAPEISINAKDSLKLVIYISSDKNLQISV